MVDATECRSCGAMLPMPDMDGHVTCLACGRRARATLRERLHLPTPPEPQQPAATWSTTPTTTTTKHPTKAGPRLQPGRGCALWLVVVGALASIAGIVGAVVAGPSDDSPTRAPQVASPFRNLIVLGQRTVLLPDPAGGDDLVVALVQVTEGSEYDRYLAGITLRGGVGTERWRTEALGRDTSHVQAVRAGDVVVAAIGHRLLALDAASGEQRWQTDLSDQVQPSCAACLAAVGDRIVVQTADGQLTSFTTASAEARWRHRLTSPTGTMVVTDDAVVVTDRADRGLEEVRALDPATGGVTGSPTSPCGEVGPGSRVQVTAIPDRPEVLVVQGYSSACAFRWNPRTGATGAGARLPDDLIVGPSTPTPVFAGDRVALAGSSTPVLADLATGRVHALSLPPDVDAVPTLVVDGVLLGTTTRNRGTPVGGLVAWDLADGRLRWTTALPDRPGILDADPDASHTVFPDAAGALLALDRAGPIVATFVGGERPMVSVRRVSVADGTLSDPDDHAVEALASSLSVSVIDPGPDRLAFVLDWHLWWLDHDGGGPLATYPG